MSTLACITTGDGQSGPILDLLPGCHVTQSWVEDNLEAQASNLVSTAALLFATKPMLEFINFLHLCGVTASSSL